MRSCSQSGKFFFCRRHTRGHVLSFICTFASWTYPICIYGVIVMSFFFFSSHPCTPYRCVGHDLSPKMTRSTCIHHKSYSNVLYASSLPYLLSYQGLCNCMRMQDASSSKYSIRLGNLFSTITESMQSLD